MFNSHELDAAGHKCRSSGAFTCRGDYYSQITEAPFPGKPEDLKFKTYFSFDSVNVHIQNNALIHLQITVVGGLLQ